MADEDELAEDAPLSAEEILTFGPCVEAVAWHPIWIQEARAPIAVAAGRPRLGPVFNSDGVGRAVVIRPCMSRGRRIRGLAPIYTPRMLESHSGVYNGWPMFMDHVPKELAATMAKHGRSVKELGGQVLTGRWQRDFVHEDDRRYGYQKGATVADIWARPFIREMVDNNPALLHTSINAWPTSGKPGACPWRPGVKGMLIEGIRSQPQGSLDYVVRGGAGGRLLLQEAGDEEGSWPELGEWGEEDRAFVVSLAESFYASRRMPEVTLPTKPDELKPWLEEHAPHLVPALEAAAAAEPDADDASKGKVKKRNAKKDGDVVESLTEQDVEQIIERMSSGVPTVEEFEQSLQERFEERLQERETQRGLSEFAHGLIERAEGIPPKWKADLRQRYELLPSGPTPTLLVEGEHTDDQGATLSEQQVVEARVNADIEHVLSLIAEAQGKPRVKSEGGVKRDPADEGRGRRENGTPYWRQEFVGMKLAESEDEALTVFGAAAKED